MYQPEYLLIALSTLGLLLRTRAAHFREAYREASQEQRALRAAVAELRTLRASEARARREAEEAARVKSQFLAHVSHEVRTPLQAISGTVQMLQDTTLTPEQEQYLEVLKTGSDTLGSLLSNILDYAKIEAGKVELDEQPLAVAEALNQAAKLVQPQADDCGIRLNWRIASDVPPVIVADPLRLRQVLLNLLSNAVKFTEDGSVTLSVSRTRANGQREASFLQFAVRDSGPGIPPHEQGKLFQPFVQGPQENGRRHGGAGLGLAICKELVTLMGGDIWVRSKPGQGSTFTFTLPLEPCELKPATG